MVRCSEDDVRRRSRISKVRGQISGRSRGRGRKEEVAGGGRLTKA